MLESISLRPTTAEDEAFLLNLYATTRTTELAVLALEELQKWAFVKMQFNAQKQQYLLSYPNADNSIILLEAEAVGRLIVDRAEHEVTLVDISLLPDRRGFGIGTYLITELLNEALKTSKPVRLQVLQTNPAKKLYERLGFSVVNSDQLYCEMISSLDRHNSTPIKG